MLSPMASPPWLMLCASPGNPYDAQILYYIVGIIRPDCVALRRPSQRTLQVACGSRALSDRRLRRFVTRTYGSFGFKEDHYEE